MADSDFVIIGAGPGGEAAAYEALDRAASAAIIDRDLFGGSCPHWCVLAIKARVPVEVLAETIHAFPSTSRIFNGLFNQARKELAGRRTKGMGREPGHMPMMPSVQREGVLA